MKADKNTQLVREREVYGVEVRIVNGYTERRRHVPRIEELCTFVFCQCPQGVNLGSVSHSFEVKEGKSFGHL